jgi:hypothetical protein
MLPFSNQGGQTHDLRTTQDAQAQCLQTQMRVHPETFDQRVEVLRPDLNRAAQWTSQIKLDNLGAPISSEKEKIARRAIS